MNVSAVVVLCSLVVQGDAGFSDEVVNIERH